MRKGLVSTIIPVYNRPAMLLEAVASVVEQDYREIEIIIVDDGSTDNTTAVALQLAEENVCISTFSIPNSGPARARELGRQKANGEFIQYLDSDDLLHSDKFSKQVLTLNTRPDCGVSYCVQQLCDMQGTVIDAAWMRSGEQFENMFPAMLGGRIWGTPVPLYRASLLQKSGAWLDLVNEEDWEYDCRVASFGVKLAYCPEVLTTVRRHDEDHLGTIRDKQEKKLIDKSIAYQAIFNHSLKANIARNNIENLRFKRMTFSLARQCALQGLEEQARTLLAICKNNAGQTMDQIEYHAYGYLSSIFGWKNVGKCSNAIDRWFK